MKPPGWRTEINWIPWSRPKYPLIDVNRPIRLYPILGPPKKIDAESIIRGKIEKYRNSRDPADHALANELQKILERQRKSRND